MPGGVGGDRPATGRPYPDFVPSMGGPEVRGAESHRVGRLAPADCRRNVVIWVKIVMNLSPDEEFPGTPLTVA